MSLTVRGIGCTPVKRNKQPATQAKEPTELLVYRVTCRLMRNSGCSVRNPETTSTTLCKFIFCPRHLNIRCQMAEPIHASCRGLALFCWDLVGSSLLIYVGVCRWTVRTEVSARRQLNPEGIGPESHGATRSRRRAWRVRRGPTS